jgi:Zn-dependent M28 family amino/carboxypeptidase
MKHFFYATLLLIALPACKQTAPRVATGEKSAAVAVPAFNADSAYRYTADQVAFGPRVPNQPEHVACGDYLAGQFRRFGAKVTEQSLALRTYKGELLRGRNIIACFGEQFPQRVLLCAHWDSRPFADYDPDPANHHTPISGANDGAGACGVLLEIARQIGISEPETGVDIILFDAEDWGTPVFDQRQYGSAGWCLGSEYWAKNPHVANYKASYGILLDMIGAPNALFSKEYFSMQYAGRVVNRIWDTGRALGYGHHFVQQQGMAVTDDHVEVFKHRKIPCVDIIQYDPDSATGFGSYWHTLDDTMENVDRETLKAVGQTVLHVVYNE